MFGWEYPPMHLGGLGVACRGLVRGLLKHNVGVTLALPYAGSDDGVEIVSPTETTFHAIRVASRLAPYDSHDGYDARMVHLPNDIREIYGSDLGQAIDYFTASAVEMTKNVHADVVHCHDWMTYEAGIRAARHHRKPLIAHIHATELDRTHFQPNMWIYKREKKGFDHADRVITVSNYTKGILVRHYGIPAEKISVVHNGNADEYCNVNPALRWEFPRRRRPTVLFLGRLTIQKGIHRFLEMAGEVHRLRPDVEFIIAGTGSMLGELIERSITLGLERNVIFAGRVDSQEAKALYAQADCFVMPSLSEPFGLVALEAAAYGTPVIVSKQSGVGEVLSHAFKVDFWDTQKMADCVMTILRDDHLAHQMRSEIRKDLLRLTWENQAGIVKSIYENTISNRSSLEARS